jgi:peptidoglycan/LPS O-acetylase OafA/YrhL
MSEPTTRPINRIPQIVLLSAGAALVIFLILLGTDAIAPGDGPTLIIGGALFAVALVAMAAEFEINRTGFSNSTPPLEEGEERRGDR